ncbi:hypothetical protein EU803_06680 [Loktanella sp. IMCC34160]|uniref:hypothetical protein n=1 Tax=Loktanella sp. IMCC34160 TaxID=2510646 RepID=UPI00101D39F0|nr:hypothetical protein [Loktanella sp. IMCC34160]RYG92123.1 hypothetical protein EU803_06680 [Loktanella sp. IMCC34160]
MLVVGNIHAWGGSDQPLPKIKGIDFVDFRELATYLSTSHPPDIILSALVGHGFDSVDLACVLQNAGFTGRYRGVASSLPRPEVIRAEVRSRAPDVDFDVLELEILAQVSGSRI